MQIENTLGLEAEHIVHIITYIDIEPQICKNKKKLKSYLNRLHPQNLSADLDH